MAPGPKLLRRLVREQQGQDLIEYALLTGIITVVGLVAFPGLVTKLGNAFSSWGAAVYDLWIPADPL